MKRSPMTEKSYQVQPANADRISDVFYACSMEVKDNTIIFRNELGSTVRLYNLREVFRVKVL